MRELVGLRAGGERSGVDAYLDFSASGRRYSVPIELKSTTVGSVSTARDVGLDHIEKWRARVWVFGFYNSSGRALEKVLVLGPSDMEPWISRIERYIAPDFMIGERAAAKLVIDDVHVICGEKDVYTLEDARALYKRQWSVTRYTSEMDVEGGYSPHRMLRILRHRARYLNNRGATLNNPHIPRGFLQYHANRTVDVTAAGRREALRRLVRRDIRQIAMGSKALMSIAAAAPSGA